MLFCMFSAPKDHLLWSNRSHAYTSVDKYKEAYHDAEMVLKLRPDWPKVTHCSLKYMYQPVRHVHVYRHQCYKSFFMLNSSEHEFFLAHRW